LFNNLSKKYSRNSLIKIAGVIGIVLNVCMAILKLFVGWLANSIAIISDAVNNLTDAMSSIVTLVGLKLSQKQPDSKHPLGYGRIEYVSAMLIATIVCIAGYEFLKTSIDRILHPEAVDFSVLQLVILGMAILIKLFLSKLNIAFGKAANSSALEASGAEARIDVLVSILTIVTAIIAKVTDWQIDGYVGLLLTIFILYTGIQLIREIISQIIGERPKKELVDKIRNDLMKYEHIEGAYDFIIHNYGPVTRLGTANLEFLDTVHVKEVYNTIQILQKDIFNTYNIYFTFGLYAVNTYDKEVINIYTNVRTIVNSLPYIIGIHAFTLDKEDRTMGFDAIVNFDMQDFKKAVDEICDLIIVTYPDYKVHVKIDLDYS
jgi:cation diffusion facilitator family transporter